MLSVSVYARLKTYIKGEFMPQEPKDTLPLLGARAVCTTAPRMRVEALNKHVRPMGNLIKLRMDNHIPTGQPKN